MRAADAASRLIDERQVWAASDYVINSTFQIDMLPRDKRSLMVVVQFVEP